MPATDRRLFDLPPDPTPACLDEALAALADRYPALHCTPSPRRITLGKGSPAAAYCAGGGIGASVLIRFAAEYSEQHARGGRLYGISIPYLAAMRSIHILPTGADSPPSPPTPVPPTCGPTLTYAQPPADTGETHPLPDTGICLYLHPGERRILLSRFTARRTLTLARVVGRLCSAPVCTAAGSTPIDSVAASGIPAFCVGLGEGNGVFEAYAGVRELLFLCPTLVGK